MAQLAAYYHEDFKCPPMASVYNQRKSAYVVYKEPEEHFYRQQQLDVDRMRNLATSDPSLSPCRVSTPNTDLTWKQRHYLHNSQLVDSPDSSVMSLRDNYYRRVPRLIEHEQFDNESLSSFYDLSLQDNRCNQRFVPRYKERSRKRYSYAEPSDGVCSPEVFTDEMHPQQRFLLESDIRNYNHRVVRPDNYRIHPPESNVVNHRQNGTWQWRNPVNAYSNATYLSPPSPLDSGLSSQSITSSPSLEAEPLSFREDAYQPRDKRHSRCSCPKVIVSPSKDHNLSNGTLSPSGFQISRPHSATRMTRSNFAVHPHVNRRLSYSSDDFDGLCSPPSQTRYGKMGIVGEVSDTDQVSPSNPTHPGNVRHRNLIPNSGPNFQNGTASRKKTHGFRYPKVASSKFDNPCLVIIESPEKADSAPSDRQNSFGKSHQGPDSPMSVTASDSPSVSSSNNELDVEEQQAQVTKKPGDKKAAERGIRELEALYEKCNLSDRDLLDRAERRDLPTAHQLNRGRLTRSNSDTLYEVLSPVFRNPYEVPRRAPPFRRAGLPDRIADDMALRKLQKPSREPSYRLSENTVTYMLCSSHFTPTVAMRGDLTTLDNPDVELDDFSYRKHYWGKKSKILDPQPPFGIPLRPPPTQKVFNDYLHAAPSEGPQPLCHPRGNPDVVRDDVAIRALRKDEPERSYYDISQFYRKRRT